MTTAAQAYDDIDFAYFTSQPPDPVSHVPGASLVGQHWLSNLERCEDSAAAVEAPLEYEIGGILKSCLTDPDDSTYELEDVDGRFERHVTMK